jgi:hypothetical protein
MFSPNFLFFFFSLFYLFPLSLFLFPSAEQGDQKSAEPIVVSGFTIFPLFV